jgi:hypothetical protein
MILFSDCNGRLQHPADRSACSPVSEET